MSNLITKNIISELKYVYSENNTLSIIFQNNDLLLGVAGEFNNNLKELEKITKTSLYSRGNSILIKSNPEKNEIIIGDLSSIIYFANKISYTGPFFAQFFIGKIRDLGETFKSSG